MAAARRLSALAVHQDELGELLENILPSRAQNLERRLLAATLKVLAAWLGEQARLLDPLEDASSAKVRVFPASACLPGTALTRREQEVACRIAHGLSNREIAEDLVITTSTTERHVANILNKLGMRSRCQVAAWAVEHRLSELQRACGRRGDK